MHIDANTLLAVNGQGYVIATKPIEGEATASTRQGIPVYEVTAAFVADNTNSLKRCCPCITADGTRWLGALVDGALRRTDG